MVRVGRVTATGYGNSFKSACRNAAKNNIHVAARRLHGSLATVSEVRHVSTTSREICNPFGTREGTRYEVRVIGDVYVPKRPIPFSTTPRYNGRMKRRGF